MVGSSKAISPKKYTFKFLLKGVPPDRAPSTASFNEPLGFTGLASKIP